MKKLSSNALKTIYGGARNPTNDEGGIVVGSVTNVTTHKIEDYTVVHNMVFDTNEHGHDNHFVEANGVVSGVLHLQEKIAHRVHRNHENEVV